MRRRWRFQWDREAVVALALGWLFLGWLPGMLLRQGVKEHSTSWTLFTVIPWFGPFVLAALLAALWVLPRALRWLWRNPPVRRVTEPVTEDLREVR